MPTLIKLRIPRALSIEPGMRIRTPQNGGRPGRHGVDAKAWPACACRRRRLTGRAWPGAGCRAPQRPAPARPWSGAPPPPASSPAPAPAEGQAGTGVAWVDALSPPGRVQGCGHNSGCLFDNCSSMATVQAKTGPQRAPRAGPGRRRPPGRRRRHPAGRAPRHAARAACCPRTTHARGEGGGAGRQGQVENIGERAWREEPSWLVDAGRHPARPGRPAPTHLKLERLVPRRRLQHAMRAARRSGLHGHGWVAAERAQ